MQYPDYILDPINEFKPYNGFRFKPSVAYFLNQISGVEIELIENCTIYSRSLFRFLPWYSAQKGGGAITLGGRAHQSITFTENFFSTDIDDYPHSAYSNVMNTWLRMAAHEVGHLTHAFRYRWLFIYLLVFAYQYLRYGHDDAPLEIEANFGSDNFGQFLSFLRREGQVDSFEEIFRSTMPEKEKVTQLEEILLKFHSKNSNVDPVV